MFENGIALGFLGFVIWVIFIAFIYSLETNNSETKVITTNEIFMKRIEYFQHSKTGICFASIDNSNRHAIAEVDCEKVKDYVKVFD